MAKAAGGLLDRGHDDSVLRASRVSRFSVSSPATRTSALATVGVCGLLLAVLEFGPAALTFEQAAVIALAGVLLPAFVFAGVAFNVFKMIGGTITAGRCMLLALTDSAVIFLFTLLANLLPNATPSFWAWGLVTGCAFAASVNMLVLAATSDPHLLRAAVPSLALPAGSLSVLQALGALNARQALIGTYFVLVFLGFSALWARIVVAPFRRNFDEDGLKLLHSLLDAWASWSSPPGSGKPSRGTLAMEAFFARHGSQQSIRVDGLLFDQTGGRKALWVKPDLHPGPYSDLGGSDLPAKAGRALAGIASEVATFHGACNHDQNPTGRDEVTKAFSQLAVALEAAPDADAATPSVRVEREGTAVSAQRIGPALVLGHTRSPRSSDDIDLSVGRAAERALEAAGEEAPLLIDGHNCVGKDLGQIREGSREARVLVEACTHAAHDAAKQVAAPLEVGFARKTLQGPAAREFAMGRGGIFATVVKAGWQKTAYVLIDGNNMKAGLREKVLEGIGNAVEAAEVFTTDNHAVNTTMGADNEVGSRGDNSGLVQAVAAAVNEAVADIKPARVRHARSEVDGVRVFGPDLTVRISTTINSSVSVMVPAYIACMVAGFLFCAALALLGT